MYRCDRCSGSGSETGRNPALYSTVLAWRYVRPIGTSHPAQHLDLSRWHKASIKVQKGWCKALLACLLAC